MSQPASGQSPNPSPLSQTVTVFEKKKKKTSSAMPVLPVLGSYVRRRWAQSLRPAPNNKFRQTEMFKLIWLPYVTNYGPQLPFLLPGHLLVRK